MKKNGFGCPSPWQQIMAWIVFVMNKTFFYTFIKIFMTNKSVIEIIFTIVSAVSTLLGFICTYIDPSDNLLINEIQKRDSAVKNQKSYVLEISKNLDFCLICSSNVESKSKHCRLCDRCVSDFDHHCIWLNNCIGGKNYKLFFLLLVVTFLDLSFNISLSIYSMYRFYRNEAVDDTNICPNVAIGFILMLTIVNIFVIANVMYLLSIHAWLRCKGLTTYEYISNDKKVDNSEDVSLKQKHRNKILPNDLVNKMGDYNDLKNIKVQNRGDKLIFEDKPVFKPIIDDIYMKNSKATRASVNIEHPHMIQVTNHNSIMSARNNGI
jgi:hypothetical protein